MIRCCLCNIDVGDGKAAREHSAKVHAPPPMPEEKAHPNRKQWLARQGRKVMTSDPLAFYTHHPLVVDGAITEEEYRQGRLR